MKRLFEAIARTWKTAIQWMVDRAVDEIIREAKKGDKHGKE